MQRLRDLLEQHQVAVYFGAVAIAAVLAWQVPASAALAPAIDPLLGFMLFATFLQVPLTELRRALANLRFLGALLASNFIAVPLLVACLHPWLPGAPLARIGVLLVLLTPCIDYVVTFAHLGRADARALLVSTPVLLGAQMLLLPLYLGVFLGEEAAGLVRWEPFLHAFAWLIAVPLGLAAALQAGAARNRAARAAARVLGVMPVPATALVLFVVVAAVAPRLGLAAGEAREAVPVYVAYAVLAPAIGWGIGRLWRLPAEQARAVSFSSATRNSLVVLPLGMAIPGAVPVLPAVIVAQTLVELAGELIYIRLLPRLGGSRRAADPRR
ncbi:arsenic resistance protein [Achromobacter denitrificans]